MTYGSGANGCLGHGNFNDVTQVKCIISDVSKISRRISFSLKMYVLAP